MASLALELLGFSLSLLGLIGTFIATVLPHWWRTAHVGTDIITAVGYTKGLWMECAWHSTGVFQCRAHLSQLALPPDLRVARATMVTSCCLSLLATGVAVVGMRCTLCARGSPAKAPLAVSAGVTFILAGLLCLAPVSWSTGGVVMDFYGPALPGGVRYEMGQALYLGFASALLTILGGALLCMPDRCPGREEPCQPHSPQRTPSWRPPDASKGNHSPSLTSAPHGGYRLSDYV
ncbi:CLD14 protein, partial [Sclerurus mexicanus]|nr:CLD14 protein [Sclerurus mexicanus]